MLMLPELSNLLGYHHEAVIRSYVRNLKVTEIEARKLFRDMLLYLWISTKHQFDKAANAEDPSLDFSFVMHQEMRQIDDMWHNFILYTRDYTSFCQNYFGAYIHHEPDIALGTVPMEEEFVQHMEKYLHYIVDNLGEEILYRWFGQYIGGQRAA